MGMGIEDFKKDIKEILKRLSEEISEKKDIEEIQKCVEEELETLVDIRNMIDGKIILLRLESGKLKHLISITPDQIEELLKEKQAIKVPTHFEPLYILKNAPKKSSAIKMIKELLG